jgi:hypothetical protein
MQWIGPRQGDVWPVRRIIPKASIFWLPKMRSIYVSTASRRTKRFSLSISSKARALGTVLQEAVGRACDQETGASAISQTRTGRSLSGRAFIGCLGGCVLMGHSRRDDLVDVLLGGIDEERIPEVTLIEGSIFRFGFNLRGNVLLKELRRTLCELWPPRDSRSVRITLRREVRPCRY